MNPAAAANDQTSRLTFQVITSYSPRRGSTPAGQQSRLGYDWPCITSIPLSYLCTEQFSHVARRTLVPQHMLGDLSLLWAAEPTPASHHSHPRRERQLRRVASCSSRSSEISPTPQPSLSPAYTAYHLPVSSCISAAAEPASELLAVCISLLPCMLSPPPHNRLTWRRTGMRYGLSASLPIIYLSPV